MKRSEERAHRKGIDVARADLLRRAIEQVSRQEEKKTVEVTGVRAQGVSGHDSLVRQVL